MNCGLVVLFMDVEHACHCTYRIRYHMVFVVKYRKKMLLERTRIEFFEGDNGGSCVALLFQV